MYFIKIYLTGSNLDHRKSFCLKMVQKTETGYVDLNKILQNSTWFDP